MNKQVSKSAKGEGKESNEITNRTISTSYDRVLRFDGNFIKGQINE